MAKISTRITFDKAAAVARIKAANDRALTIMGNQALKDANIHVPIDQSTLKQSGITNSDDQAVDGKFTLRWNEPYAQYLWHGHPMTGTPLTRDYDRERMLDFTKAVAQAEWAKYAKEVYGENWKKVYQAALKKELGES